MKTKIIKIENRIVNGSEFKTIFFNYCNKEQFVYFSKKTEEYFKKYREISEIKEGMIINVFKVPNTNYYKIINIEKEVL